MAPLSAAARLSSTSSFRYAATDADPARLVAHAVDVHANRARRQERRQLVGPLHDRHAVAREQLVEAELEELGEALRAVGIDVMHREPAAVLVDEHEGRAHDAALHTEAARDALREAR